jgi:uncharacterized protein YhdP
MKIPFLKMINYLLIALTCVVIIFAICVALLRTIAPGLTGERPTIEAYLTQKLHHPVKVESIALRWHYLTPVLNIHHIEIFKSNTDAQKIFAIRELSVGVRFISSLWHREILLKYFFVDGLDLSLVHDQTGKWQIKGLSDLNFFDQSSSSVRKSLTLKGKNLSLFVEGIFPKTILIQHFTARLIIEKTPPGSKIMLNKISIQNEDVDVTGHLAFLKDHIDLNVKYHLYSSIILRLDNYLPHNLLNPELIHWLKQAVRKLDSGDGVFILAGDLKNFPCATKPGEFLVDTHLKNITLKYDPEWPIATNVDGELIFQGNNMQMHIASAEMSHVKLDHIEAVIPKLGNNSVLNIKGKASADSKDFLQFVQQSPLKKTVGKYFKGYQWSGPAELQLGITIPLSPKAKPDKSRVTGLLTLNQNKLVISPESILANLKANIHFTEAGMTGNNLNCTLWGMPLRADISSNKYLISYNKWRLVFNDRGGGVWGVDVFHPQLVGVLTIPSGLPPKSISGQFKYLAIPDDKSSPTPTFKQTIQPRKIPALIIVINDFRYHDKFFGHVNFNTIPMRSGLKLNSLQSTLGGTVIKMSGFWMQTSRGKYSNVVGSFTSRSMTETLKNWGLVPSIQSSSATGNYTFNWPGDLYSPDIKNFSGNIHFDIGKGQILNVGSQAKMDIGRLLTMLSFQSLGKRLRLDFSDLTTVGLNFDTLTGNFHLNYGIASTSNTRLDGPISAILMTGSIDLVNQTYQLKLLVTPHLTSSLPIIATIAGGPVAGAATWVVDKLFNQVVNKITSDTYTITGPWTKPVIK